MQFEYFLYIYPIFWLVYWIYMILSYWKSVIKIATKVTYFFYLTNKYNKKCFDFLKYTTLYNIVHIYSYKMHTRKLLLYFCTIFVPFY